MKMTIQGLKCPSNDCTDPLKKTAISGSVKLWSNASTWPGNRVPRCGEAVEIKLADNILYDLTSDPCIYKVVVVNGRLTLKPKVSASP
jgi:hypothetical protein